MKKISENGKIPCPWIGRIRVVKVTILTKAIYRFNAISIKIPTQFFTVLERTILRFIQKSQKPRIAKTFLYDTGTSRDTTIPYFKLYYRTIVIKTAFYWHKNRHVAQWNWIQAPDMSPHTYESLILTKKSKLYNGKKKVSSANAADVTGCRHVKEWK